MKPKFLEWLLEMLLNFLKGKFDLFEVSLDILLQLLNVFLSDNMLLDFFYCLIKEGRVLIIKVFVIVTLLNGIYNRFKTLYLCIVIDLFHP